MEMGFLSWYKNVIKDTLNVIKDTLIAIYHWKGWAYFELYVLGGVIGLLVGIFIPCLALVGKMPFIDLAWTLTLPLWITIGLHGYYRIEHC